MSYKMISQFLFLVSLPLLVGCTHNTVNKQVTTTVQEDQKDKSSKSEEIIRNSQKTYIGFISKIEPGKIYLSTQNDRSFISMVYETEKVNQKIISKLKVGQKIKIYDTGLINASIPGIGEALKIEILK